MHKLLVAVILGLVFVSAGPAATAAAGKPVVRAVLFTSPTCPHCAQVREEVLPPLAERFGQQLQVAIISIEPAAGRELFLKACLQHGLARLSVPLLIVGNKALVGSKEIPEQFPDLIAKHVAADGMDWPDISGLRELLVANKLAPAEAPQQPETPATASTAAQPPQTAATAQRPAPEPAATPRPKTGEPAKTASAPAAAAAPAKTARPPEPHASAAATAAIAARQAASSTTIAPEPAPPSPGNPAPAEPAASAQAESGIIDLTGDEPKPGIFEKIMRDPAGNGVAIVVLILMIAVAAVSIAKLRKPVAAGETSVRARYDWLIPVLVVAGLFVAGYLSSVELRNVEAVCGPVGDCNTVQQSKYARLFGVLPIGVLGLMGFAAIFVAWVVRRRGKGRLPLYASVAMLGMTAFGILFSIYLTFLEPFVIGATCLWCVSSAVIMTLLYIMAIRPGRTALALLKR